jgi:hypothetical protein
MTVSTTILTDDQFADYLTYMSDVDRFVADITGISIHSDMMVGLMAKRSMVTKMVNPVQRYIDGEMAEDVAYHYIVAYYTQIHHIGMKDARDRATDELGRSVL